MEDFRAIISCWHPVETLAKDIEQKGGTVRQWRLRNFIPPEHWASVVAAAERRGHKHITLERLAAIAARRPSEQRARQRASQFTGSAA